MFNFFKKNKKPENFKELLFEIEKLNKNLENVSKELKELKEKNKLTIQRIAILRFNPFKEMGGNQSFSLALLDGNNDGVVITSLFSKEGSRVYGKPIKSGTSEFPLTEEEKMVIEKAKYGESYSKSNSKNSGSGNSRTHR